MRKSWIAAAALATAAMVPVTGTVAFAKGGAAAPTQTATGGGSGKGGSTTAVAVPADWPAEVPVPDGTLTGVNHTAGSTVWVLALTMPGDATAVDNYLTTFYGAVGFTANPAYFPKPLTRADYTITGAMFPHDHSATATDLVLQLSRNS